MNNIWLVKKLIYKEIKYEYTLLQESRLFP